MAWLCVENRTLVILVIKWKKKKVKLRTLKCILNADVKERRIYTDEDVEIRKQFYWDFKGEFLDTFKALKRINKSCSWNIWFNFTTSRFLTQIFVWLNTISGVHFRWRWKTWKNRKRKYTLRWIFNGVEVERQQGEKNKPI